ncbi:PREDICTED: FAR1-RELATED SEQUENCE [Prunus dulcis]|uniref:PREDICTED: FAR1-RELATED SEQUENCE n=1 Tax=Prunus dulcis TaxID=3755 RepID=A0A5E4G4B1_PRUDU|nr:PREDICTED: FAR1-RELATED SEQUENCE [Prunus dulcis]
MNKQFDDLVKKALGVNGSLVGDILNEDVMSKFWFQGLVDNLFAHLPTFLGDEYSSCSNMDFEQIVDCTSEFTTKEIFNSREELIRWAREVGRANGFVIVTLRSDQGGKGNKKPRVTLGCERYEEYRKRIPKKDIKDEDRRHAGSKRCGCPFELKSKKLKADDHWLLIVVTGVHNHIAAAHLEGNSFAGRLSFEETSLLLDMSKSFVRPKEILIR